MESESPGARIKTIIMDLQESMNFDKEEWLEAMVRASSLSPEEFSRDYVLEEYPIEITRIDDILDNRVTAAKFTVNQNFRVRPKTNEERQLEIESKEKKDDSSKPE